MGQGPYAKRVVKLEEIHIHLPFQWIAVLIPAASGPSAHDQRPAARLITDRLLAAAVGRRYAPILPASTIVKA